MLYIAAEKKIVKIKITLILVVMSELKLNNWKDLDFGNPISGNIFCADPTAVEFEGRLYVYGTNDHEQYLNAEKNTYEKKLAYNNEYNRQNYRSFSIRMNREEEKHIINWLEKQKSLKKYIISLIEKDMREKKVN